MIKAQATLLLRHFVGKRETRVTVDQAQGTMGRRKRRRACFLLPAFLCAPFFIDFQRGVWVRGRLRQISERTLLSWPREDKDMDSLHIIFSDVMAYSSFEVSITGTKKPRVGLDGFRVSIVSLLCLHGRYERLGSSLFQKEAHHIKKETPYS